MDYGNLKVPENVTPEVQAILDSYEARNKEIENAHRKNMFRIGLGTALSGASAHPILNVPYVGTGLGGALYELGQGITEGNKLPELAKRTGTGFAIGETVGAIPYAGKYANKLSGGKIGNALTAGVEKLASTPLGQKVAEIAPKVEDLLMTDIKAFNPNKQTVYHGSPYDFTKFSNEAIGTGEGAQAHGYGHYVALDKDVADIRYRQALTGDDFDNMQYFYNGKKIGDKREKAILATILENGKDKVLQVREKSLPWSKYNAQEYDEKLKEIEFIKAINENLIKKDTDKGQLYKLSIPKDDVMLREDLPFSQQPPKVQEALKNLGKTYNDLFDNNEIITNIEYFPNTTRGKDIYGSLMRDLGDEVAVSDELYHNGIKGISYNGGVDGEARVIFNPDDIEIVRKFYNQPQAMEYFQNFQPNFGAVVNSIETNPVNTKEWKQYAKNNLIGNSVDIPGYTTVNFTNKNLGKDYPYNMPEYETLLDDLTKSKYAFSTNYNNEADRFYDHLVSDRKGLFDYLIEVIQDTEGNIHHNYKMMKNINRGDKP